MAVLTTRVKPNRRVATADDGAPFDDKHSGVVETQSYDTILFFIDLEGGASMTVQPIWWDEDLGAWYKDAATSYIVADKYLLGVMARGKKCFLLVTAIAAGATAVIQYALSKTRSI